MSTDHLWAVHSAKHHRSESCFSSSYLRDSIVLQGCNFGSLRFCKTQKHSSLYKSSVMCNFDIRIKPATSRSDCMFITRLSNQEWMVAELQDEAATQVNAVCVSIAMFERVKLLFLSRGNCVSTFISLIPLGILGTFPDVCVATKPGDFNKTWGLFQLCLWQPRLDIFHKKSGHYDVFLATKTGCSSQKSDHLQPHLWPHNQVFLKRPWDISSHVCPD